MELPWNDPHRVEGRILEPGELVEGAVLKPEGLEVLVVFSQWEMDGLVLVGQ